MATDNEMFDEETERLRQEEIAALEAQAPGGEPAAPAAPETPKFTNIPENMAKGEGWQFRPNDRAGLGQDTEFAPGGKPSAKSQLDDMAIIGPNGPVSSGMTTMRIPEDPAVTAKIAGIRAQAEKEFGKKRADEMFSERSMKNFNDAMSFSVANGAPDPANRRKDFENKLFEQIGGNPFMLDPIAEVRKADAELPKLFEAVFRGQATWADMPNLSKEQKAHWQNVVNAYHAHVKETATSKQQQMYRAYKHGMEQFDWEDKKYEKQEDQIRKQEIEMIKQSGKIPKFSTMLNDKGQWTVHAYDPKTGQFNDTGKIGKKSDAVKSVTTDQALSVLRFIAPSMSDNPLSAFFAGNSAGNDPNKLSAFMGAQERKVAPEYRGLFRYYMSVLFANAGLEMGDEVGGPSATPKAAPTPPSNYSVFDPKANNGRGGLVPKTS